MLARGGGRDDFLRAVAESLHVSADMTHATHPSYTDRHEPGHWVALGGGHPRLELTYRGTLVDGWTRSLAGVCEVGSESGEGRLALEMASLAQTPEVDLVGSTSLALRSIARDT